MRKETISMENEDIEDIKTELKIGIKILKIKKQIEQIEKQLKNLERIQKEEKELQLKKLKQEHKHLLELVPDDLDE